MDKTLAQDSPSEGRKEGSQVTSHESTVRYLGIEVDDGIEIAEKIDI